MNFGDTEGVGYKRLIVRKLWCVEELHKDDNYRFSVGYRRRGNIGWNARRRRQWSRLRLMGGCEFRQELGRRRRRSREGQLLQWRRSSCWLELGEIGIFWKSFFFLIGMCEKALCGIADEMGVCRGYVGVFIDSPDTQTHDPSSLRKRVKAFLLCCGHPSQDVWIRHHYPHYSVLWPSSILAQRLRVRLYPSKIGTSSVLSYKNTILTGDNSRHPRSQQIGMGSNTCSRFLEQIEKTYDIVNIFLDVTWAGGIGMAMVYPAVWRVGSFSFLIFDFHN